ncbi:MAG: T9SS type A sorting domain-containing protein [Flavobacteriales bacterium]|nr:T9SS type A sorting domain-containing protein [Flavobacteriales bacterium]
MKEYLNKLYKRSEKLVLIFALTISGITLMAQPPTPNQLEEPLSAYYPGIEEFYLAQLRACNNKIHVFMEFQPVSWIDKITRQPVTVSSIEVIPKSNPLKVKRADLASQYMMEIYDLTPNRNDQLEFTLNTYDSRNNLLSTQSIVRSTRRTGEVVVSDRLFADIYNMKQQHSNNIFSYFCGKKYSKIELLAFFQDFLELSEAEICRFEVLYNIAQLQTSFTNDEIVHWTSKYCDLLEDYWDDQFVGPDTTNQDTSDCNCKIIKSSTFVDHSAGGVTGVPLENCPDVGVTEGSKIKSHTGTIPRSNEDQNWIVNTWAYMGAAKSLYTISQHWEGGDENSNLNHTLFNSTLKSSVSFQMKCYDPYSAEIDTTCRCEKYITTSAQYVSKVIGQAGTEGSGFPLGGNSGKVKSCMEDFAFFTRFTRTEGTVLDDGFAVSCVECESTDTSSIWTTLTSIKDGLTDVIPIFLDSNSGFTDYFDGAITVGQLIEDIFFVSTPPCGQNTDTTYFLINKTDHFTLTPQNDFVSYIITSRVSNITDFENDESWSELHLISDYYLASGLESSGDSSCCKEKVGAYLIGNLSEFQESKLLQVSGSGTDNGTYNNHSFTVQDPLKGNSYLELGGLYQNSPNSLLRLQRDVALFFFTVDADFLEDVFGIEDCGPGCQQEVDCYFNCGYWGTCHESDTSSVPVKLRMKYNSIDNSSEYNIYPNPIEEGAKLSIEIGQSDDLQELFIFTMDGKLLHRQKIEQGQQLLEIDSNILTKGINMIAIKKGGDTIYFKKLIK